jgi:CRP/FNR family cyclic AMP-dependent transcriptional regulator
MTNPSAAACPIFQGFSVEEYEQVLALLSQESYPKGHVIIDEGKSQQDLWIIVQGSCEVVKMNKSKSQQRLATIEAGAVFGEMSFFQKAPHSATVRALTAVKVLRLTRENFEALQSRSPASAYKIAMSILAVMAQRIRRMDDWICDFIERPEGANHREEWHDFRSKLYADWQF